MATIISVIIPVYNVECYLHRCVDSVLTQSFKDIEVILVDDGSTDNSGTICDEYVRKDDRIKVIHKENGGLVSARKAGFEASCGKYIANVDSDDWLELNHLEVLYNALQAKGAEIAQCGYFIDYEDRQEKVGNRPTSEKSQQLICDFMTGKVHSGVVMKLIDRRLYEMPDFRFPLCDFNEDLHTSISLIINTNKCVFVPECTYHYRMNSMQMTKKLTMDSRFSHQLDLMINLEDLYRRLNIDLSLIYHRVNPGKRDLVKFFPHEKVHLTELLSYFPKSFLLKDVRSFGDFFYYLASRWQILWPYRIKSIL